MPRGNTARTAATVAKGEGTSHVFCPSCDNKIHMTSLVEWYLESLIRNLFLTGKPVKVGRLGTFYLKRGKLAWRSDASIPKRFRDREDVKLEVEKRKQNTWH